MASPQSQPIRQMLLQQKEAAKNHPPAPLEEQRRNLDAMGQLTPVPADAVVERTTIGGVPGEWVSVPESRADRVFLYLHGGAYFLGSCASHRGFAVRLARACEARVALIEYRLAPEHRFPAAVEDAVAAYKAILESGVEPGRVVIGGDSAGGGLTGATLVALRDTGVPLPACAVLLSPWTDLATTGESLNTRAERDPFLDADGIRLAPKVYLGDADPRHPLASPLYADLRGLPPLLIQVGDDECLLDDSVRFADKAKAAGVDATLHIFSEMWHVFQTFPIPEADEAIREIGEFVRRHTP
ncbi:MAG: alpha/beta hydrolase [Thermoflavifilum sp.]|nr:alpha/beta hydrolase [Thermoflavifilum sp.]MCL6513123.1 alpha/beta hydrolase [Alicyclobacillus sp.]